MTIYDSKNNPYSSADEIITAVRNGQLSASEAQALLAHGKAQQPILVNLFADANRSYNATSDMYNYLNNMIAQETANSANEFTEHLRDTSLTSAAQQLAGLGLSSTNVVSTGGVTPGAAGVSGDMTKYNPKEEELNRKMGLAKSVVSLVGSMASAGIYGNALLAAKNSAAKLSSQAAHSAESIDYKRLIYEQALQSSYQNMMNNK